MTFAALGLGAGAVVVIAFVLFILITKRAFNLIKLGIVLVIGVAIGVGVMMFMTKNDSKDGPNEAVGGDNVSFVGDVSFIYGTTSGGNITIITPGDKSQFVDEKSTAESIPEQEESENNKNESESDKNESDSGNGITVTEEQIKDIIVGTWETAYRSGDYIDTSVYIFSEDGVFNFGGAEFMYAPNAPELFGYEADGWEVVPMGFPYEYGTYEIHGDIIELECIGSDVEGDYPDSFAFEIKVTELIASDEAVFSVRGEDGRTYLKNKRYNEIEELCELLGVDIEP